MTSLKRRLFVGILAAVSAGSGLAQTYPSRPIKFVVGKAAGTNPDVFARIVANKLERRLGQPVVVENRVGASGTIAAKAVMSAEPDGYTLLVDSVAALHPVLTRNNAVDARKDLTPVSQLFAVPYVLYSTAKLPLASLPELVSYSKSHPPGTLNFASTAPQLDLIMDVLKQQTGLTYTSIPYKGGGPAAITSLISGETALTISGIVPFPPHIRAGTIRAVMIMAGKRSQLLPAVMTAAEAGIPNLEVGTNVGAWAPPGTPPEITRRLSAELVAVARDPEVVEQARVAGADAVGTTPEEQLRVLEKELTFWTEAARLSNFKPQ